MGSPAVPCVSAPDGGLVLLFSALDVGPPTARIDINGMEHHVSAGTLAAIERFVTDDKAGRTRGPVAIR